MTARALPRLHAVTDAHILALADFTARARAILQSPDVAVHVRSHPAEGRRLTTLAALLAPMCAASGAAMFVNDRADVAVAAGAAGLHLPAAGLPISAARALTGVGTWIGRSAHSVAEARRANDEGADYVFVGPIWETDSHPGRPALGLDVLAGLHGIKVIAIGGITAQRIADCMDAGAYGVAAIGALWRARDPAAAVNAMLLSLAHDDDDRAG